MVPGLGGGGGQSSADDGPDRHELLLASNTGGESFEATVTVTKDGSQVFERTITSDGNGAYWNLTAFDEPGPYTVTVNTTLPAASGNRSDRFQVNGSLGNATLVNLRYLRIDAETFGLPRQNMTGILYVTKRLPFPANKTVVVKYRGETVVSETLHRNGSGPFEVGSLPKTGVYQVSMRDEEGEQRWTNQTVVVTDPGAKLAAEFTTNEDEAVVYGPNERVPDPRASPVRRVAGGGLTPA